MPLIFSCCELGLEVLVSGGEDSEVLSQAGTFVAKVGKLRPTLGVVCVAGGHREGNGQVRLGLLV